MTNDIRNSKVLNEFIYSSPNSSDSFNICNFPLQFPIKAIIVTKEYWPKFKNNFVVKLPDIIQEHLNYYKMSYEKYKVE